MRIEQTGDCELNVDCGLGIELKAGMRTECRLIGEV